MIINPDSLHTILSKGQQPHYYWVAFSGGLDSTVLLHAMLQQREMYGTRFSAIHINHQLQPEAQSWRSHCHSLCNEWNIPFIGLDASIDRKTGDSLEAVARDIRYQLISEQMQPDDVLLTAHHQDDQAETLLLRILRGSGTAGLTAIPQTRGLGQGRLLRPLLDFSREQLKDYATEHGLQWLEDPSNQSISFDRNYLRQEIFPVLKRRWPSVAKTFSRVARHAQNEQALLDEYAAELLVQCQGKTPYQMCLLPFQDLSVNRQRLVLRFWIRALGHQVPDERNLNRVLEEIIPARPDANPQLDWNNLSIRRFQNNLWLVRPQASIPPKGPIHWSRGTKLSLPDALGILSIEQSDSGISRELWDKGRIHVSFRTETMQCQPAGRQGRRPLKKIFQELGVPPWERGRVPLIFIDNELAAISDLMICEKYYVKQSEAVVIKCEV